MQLSQVLFSKDGLVLWLILFSSAVAVVVFIERFLHFHRAQINSMEFLNGVRTVLKRSNVVEALSICDATPGPVARLVKIAILNREHGRERVREALEEAGWPRCRGWRETESFGDDRAVGAVAGSVGDGAGFHPHVHGDAGAGIARPRGPAFQRGLAGVDLRGGRFGRGYPGARGLQLPGQPGQFHRVGYGTGGDRDHQCGHRDFGTESAMKFPRNARIFRGRLDAAPFAAVFFLLAMFLLLASLIYTPGVHVELPLADDLPRTDKPTVAVAVDTNGRLYYENQAIAEAELKTRLREAVQHSAEPLTLVVQADRAVTYERLIGLTLLARDAGIASAWLGHLARAFASPADSKP